jgi:hypothetical protein
MPSLSALKCHFTYSYQIKESFRDEADAVFLAKETHFLYNIKTIIMPLQLQIFPSERYHTPSIVYSLFRSSERQR